MKAIQRIALECSLARNRISSKRHSEERSLFQWGIVGTGFMGEQFSRYLARTRGVNIRAVHSRSKQRGRQFSKRHGAVAYYDNITDMVRGERGRLDAVYIATPVLTHYEIAKPFLEAGYNVLCEKPLCVNRQQAEELFDIAHRSGAFLFSGMWSLYLPTVVQASEWVNEGKIGEIERIEASIQKERQGGEPSCLLDFGAYPIAFALRFLHPGRLSITAAACRDEGGIDRSWNLEVTDAQGVSAHIELSTLNAGESSAHIIGSAGVVEIPSQFNRASTVRLLSLDGRLDEEKSFSYRCDGFEYEINKVILTVRHATESNLQEAESLALAAMMEELSREKAASFNFTVAL